MQAIVDLPGFYLVIGALVAFAAGLGLRKIGRARLKAGAAWSIEALRRLAVSAGSLVRALSPALVPLVVVVAYTTTFYSSWAQLVAGAFVVWLVWFLWFAEGRIEHDRAAAKDLAMRAGRSVVRPKRGAGQPGAPQTARRGLSETAILWLGALVLVAIFVVISLVGEPSWVVELGLLTIAAALVLRLGGYLTSWVRGLVVAAVVVIVARAFTFIGLLPLEQSLFGLGGGRFWVSLAVPFAFLVGAICWEAVRLHGQDAAPPGARHQLARALGFVLSCAAALALVSGMVVARRDTTPGVKPVADAADASRNVTLANVSGSQDRKLVWTFAPILRLHPDEKYLPSSAADYVAHLHDAQGKPCSKTLPSNCANLRCPDCAAASYSEDKSLHPEGVVYYARIAKAGSELSAWPASAKDKLATLIQYWIFYDYDRWSANTALGDLVQEHDSDWEFVAVGLDPSNRPIFLALSAHCGGQLVPWDSNLAVLPGRVVGDKVRIFKPGEDGDLPDGTKDREATHPIVAVALGSHANYADDSGRRPPDWGSCTHVPSHALGPLVYASNVRDHTASSTDQRLLFQADEIKVVTQQGFPMDFPGTWGEESVSLGFRHWDHRKGPSSPPDQTQSWSNSIRSFLCSKYWTREGSLGSDALTQGCPA